jgi:hypothetical protein
MGAFPFRKDFEPFAQIGEKVRILGVGITEKCYEITHVEPIQPFIVDFASSDFYGGSIPAHGSSGYNTKSYDMKEEFSLWENMLGQYRIDLLDDIVLEVSHIGSSNRLYGIKYKELYLMKELPRHTVFKRTTATGTEASVWTTTNTTETGRRVARIVKLIISNEAASAGELRLGDGDGTGTDASAANADISIEVGAGESVILHRDELPETEFYTGITWQVSAQPMRLTVTVEEDYASPFKSNHNRELFVFEDNYPYMRCINPLAVAQTTARMLVSGFKYMLKELPTLDVRAIPVPVSKGQEVSK